MSQKKRKTSWNDKYSQEFGFIKKADNNECKAFCTLCSTQFSIANGGRRDIMQHIETNRHQYCIKAGSSNKKVSDFFKQFEGTKDELIIAAKEATIAFHTAMHNLSFRSNDCTASLIRNFFESKFSLARTKTAAIITNVIAPFIDRTMKYDIENRHFITIMTDTSNRKNIKLLPVVLRCFNPVKGVVNYKALIKSIPNEQSSTVSSMLMDVIHTYNLYQKIIAYSADNTNLNFGGVERQGRNNVWRKLQLELNRNVIGNGCNAHIMHNAITAGCEILDVDIEAVMVKLYKHFSIFSVRTESFKSLCDEMEESYKPLLNHASTRFLSLDPAVRRLIEIFEPLKEYFLTLKNCPSSILKFFNNPDSKFWILFVSNQLLNFNNSIRLIESSKITVFEIANQMKVLKDKLTNRQSFCFLPHESQQEFEKLDNQTKNEVKKKVTDFYGTILNYLDIWNSALDGAESFTWMLMYKSPSWNDVELSVSYAAGKYGENFFQIVNRDILFDEFCLLKNFADEKIPIWLNSKLSPENIWIKIFTNFRENSTALTNMEKLAEFAFCLAGTSTEVERIFSLMNNIWDDDKSRLDVSTLNAILSIQYNSKMSCHEFFNHVKKEVDFLRDVISQEKYNNENVK